MSFGKYEYCGNCRYCIADDARDMVKNGKFYCDRERTWVYADARPLKSSCFWQVAGYNLSSRDEAFKLSKKYRGFYIVTYIYETLSLNRDELEILYAFKNNYLKDTDFESEYEEVGPMIVDEIKGSDNAIDVAKFLYNTYIAPILDIINDLDFDTAASLYVDMYKRLKTYYGLDIKLLTKREKDQEKKRHILVD